MCGITGVWSFADFALSREALPRMTAAIAHRGPDDAGHWFDEAAGIALGLVLLIIAFSVTLSVSFLRKRY